MPWGVKGKVELRLEFVKRAQDGESISSLCREFEVSRPTGYLWVRRYTESGTVNSLFDRSHRPRTSPNQINRKLEGRICALREKYGWGARKIQWLLAKQDFVVSVATINRVYKRNGLLIPEDCYRPAPNRFERSQPNELWQADFKGPIGQGTARCEPLSVIDDHSRYLTGLIAVPSKQIPDVKRAFTRIFHEYGVPEALLLDHGVPWWCTSHFLGFSKLSVWLMRQDLKLIFSGVNHPQTQGKVERFHRSLGQAVRTKGTPARFSQWGSLLKNIRYEYNCIRPHEALGMMVPQSRYRESLKAFNPKPRPIEYPQGSTVVRLDSHGSFRHKAIRCFVSRALAKEFVRVEELDQSIAVYYRNSIVREIHPSGKTNFVHPDGAWRRSPPWGASH